MNWSDQQPAGQPPFLSAYFSSSFSPSLAVGLHRHAFLKLLTKFLFRCSTKLHCLRRRVAATPSTISPLLSAKTKSFTLRKDLLSSTRCPAMDSLTYPSCPTCAWRHRLDIFSAAISEFHATAHSKGGQQTGHSRKAKGISNRDFTDSNPANVARQQCNRRLLSGARDTVSKKLAFICSSLSSGRSVVLCASFHGQTPRNVQNRKQQS